MDHLGSYEAPNGKEESGKDKDADLLEKDALISQIRESDATLSRPRQEDFFDISTELKKDDSNLGNYVKSKFRELMFFSRTERIGKLPLIEQEIANIKDSSSYKKSEIAEKYAFKLIKKLKLEEVINGKKPGSLIGVEKEYKEADEDINITQEYLKKSSIFLLNTLINKLPEKDKGVIQKNTPEIINEQSLFLLGVVVDIGFAKGDLNKKTKDSFEKFILDNQEQIKKNSTATKKQMKALDEWNEAA